MYLMKLKRKFTVVLIGHLVYGPRWKPEISGWAKSDNRKLQFYYRFFYFGILWLSISFFDFSACSHTHTQHNAGFYWGKLYSTRVETALSRIIIIWLGETFTFLGDLFHAPILANFGCLFKRSYWMIIRSDMFETVDVCGLKSFLSLWSTLRDKEKQILGKLG